VRLELSSPDVIHSFWIPELAGKTDLIPGQRNEAWLEASHVGVYHGQCAEYCGLQHAHMGSIVVADTPDDFARWAAGQRASAPAAADSTARVGEFVFVRSCGACHSVRGTDALGRVGPDLTHLASRSTIAAGLLPNTEGNLIAWINNAQTLKPGAKMPSLALDGRDLVAVVTYLRTLH
jgi:cytochrome c oxidase subunit 2